MSTTQQLSLLQEVVASHVLPRLPLSALQNLSHTRSATRLAVHGVPDAVLQQLAAVRPCSLELRFALRLLTSAPVRRQSACHCGNQTPCASSWTAWRGKALQSGRAG